MTVMIRVDESTRDRVKRVAKKEGKNISEIIAIAIDEYERGKILNAFNAAYAKVRKNPKERDILDKEMREWDSMLLDGLDEED